MRSAELRYLMVCVTLLCGLLSVNILSCSALDDRKERSTEIKECLSAVDIEAQLHCSRNLILSKNARQDDKSRAFSLIMKKWQNRDGSVGPIISDIFIDILAQDYKIFFMQMKEYPSEYDQWLRELGRSSFVWYKEPPSPLERKRKKLITQLQAITGLDEKEAILHKKLLNKLRKIRTRQID